jgi:diphosphomevalonate decarboxylase
MLDYKNTKLILDSSNLKEGTIAWQTPSNIALVKYWGKHGVQQKKGCRY